MDTIKFDSIIIQYFSQLEISVSQKVKENISILALYMCISVLNCNYTTTTNTHNYGQSGHWVGAITTTTTNTHMVIEALGGCGLHS